MNTNIPAPFFCKTRVIIIGSAAMNFVSKVSAAHYRHIQPQGTSGFAERK